MTAPTPGLDVVKLRRLVDAMNEGGRLMTSTPASSPERGAAVRQWLDSRRELNGILIGLSEHVVAALEEREGLRLRVEQAEGEARQANALLRVYKGTNGRLAARTEMVEQALVAVREQAGEEDWFVEDRPISLIHLGHLQKPNPDCELCAARGRRSAQP